MTKKTRNRRGGASPVIDVSTLKRKVNRAIPAALLRLDERRFERRLGVETSGVTPLEGLSISAGDPNEGNLYGPEPFPVIRWWLGELPADVGPFTFVDLGSGKGRLLLVAAEHGFGRVIGVEFARELHEAAVENLRRARLHSTTEIVPLLGDAGEFEFPAEPLVVHVNNSFHERVMTRVIEHLSRSYHQAPRPIQIVYHQNIAESDRSRTQNVELLAAVPFLTHRRLAPASRLRRWMLRPWLLDVFESPEMLSLRRP
jgi:SAM-dependent methyltransferase